MPADRTAAFDLHGTVGIRLADATAKDVATVRRQLGPLEAALTREPDLLIRFVDRLPDDGELRYLGVADAAYTDTRYLILRGRHKTDVKAAIPFDRIGADGPCELIVERGLIAVPLLVAIVNLTMFARGLLPLHAGGFVHDGLGILTVGWAKGGKSETLLAFAAGPAWSQNKIDLAVFHPEKNFWTPTLMWWIAEVDKATQGRVKIPPHFAGALVPLNETMKAVRDGLSEGQRAI